MSAARHRLEADELVASPSAGLSGDIEVPGDKSMSHRALILGALATGETRIGGLLESDDVLSTIAALRAFGVGPEASHGQWVLRGGPWQSPSAPVDCGNSGTGVRLLMGAAAGQPVEVTFTGDASLSRRPMERVLAPLRTMGAQARGSRLPVTLRGGALRGISIVNASASAQVKSAVLLAGLRARGEVEVVEPAPSRDHSEHMLRVFGCEVETAGGTVRLGARRELTGTSVEIPGDPSSAAFPIVAALTVPGSVLTIRSVMVSPLRFGLYATLQAMGAEIAVRNRRSVGGETVADLSVGAGPLRGVVVPAERAPAMIDEYPILAVAAACAAGRTIMHGLGELRVKESDRLAAIIAGLKACGVEASAEGDTLIVDGCGGPPPGGGAIAAFLDHRIAMSFLVLGLAARAPVRVDGAAMIATSFPGFAELMRAIGGRIG